MIICEKKEHFIITLDFVHYIRVSKVENFVKLVNITIFNKFDEEYLKFEKRLKAMNMSDRLEFVKNLMPSVNAINKYNL